MLAQEETIDLDSWAFTSNYPAGTATGTDTNSPTFVQVDGNIAWGAKFPARDISGVESYVKVEFTLTVDGGFGGGSTLRLGVFNDNALLGSAAGDPPVYGGATGGFTGYLWCISSGGNAPGSSDGDAGTGTIMGKGSDSGNWLSTYNGYSLVPEGDMGAETDPEAGTYDFVIELYRYDASNLEITLTITQTDGDWTFDRSFLVDTDGAAALELMSVNSLLLCDLTVEETSPYNWAISNAKVTGVPGAEAPTWGGQPVDSMGWVDTGDWLGVVNVANAPWVWLPRMGYIYMMDPGENPAGGWAYVVNPGASN
mgnify:CR=1 FL=1